MRWTRALRLIGLPTRRATCSTRPTWDRVGDQPGLEQPGPLRLPEQQFGGAGVTLTNSANPAPQQLQVPSDVTNLNVACQQVSSSGSNTFGGYSVVAGVNSHGQIANSASPGSCTSLNADPVGGGSATLGQEVGNSATCLTYQGGPGRNATVGFPARP